jgi:beta-xylosidase
MGLLHEDGTPKLALKHFPPYTPELGICQWFHFEDYRLDQAVRWLRTLNVRYLRTGLSWSDSLRPGAMEWFDRQMRALEEFDVTLTMCFTPESCGVQPHHTSPPQRIEEFAAFCARMVHRYSSAGTATNESTKKKSTEEGDSWPVEANPDAPPTATKCVNGPKPAADAPRS